MKSCNKFEFVKVKDEEEKLKETTWENGTYIQGHHNPTNSGFPIRKHSGQKRKQHLSSVKRL